METIKGHQGDVIFNQLDSLPKGFEKVGNKPLAIGATNHIHVLTGDVERYEKENRVIYKVNKEASLQHTDHSYMNEGTYASSDLLPIKDHNPHILPAGIYEFFIQKSYNPYKKIMEKVRD